jgi:hypothetical protein
VDETPGILCQAINVSKGGMVIAERVEVAGISFLRRRGLLGRDGLATGDGLYLTPCEWLHTFGMRFCIDVAFLSSSGQVLAVCHNLKPNRLSPFVWLASGALELKAGSLRSTNTEGGDAVQLLNMKTRQPVLV